MPLLDWSPCVMWTYLCCGLGAVGSVGVVWTCITSPPSVRTVSGTAGFDAAATCEVAPSDAVIVGPVAVEGADGIVGGAPWFAVPAAFGLRGVTRFVEA